PLRRSSGGRATSLLPASRSSLDRATYLPILTTPPAARRRIGRCALPSGAERAPVEAQPAPGGSGPRPPAGRAMLLTVRFVELRLHGRRRFTQQRPQRAVVLVHSLVPGVLD